MVLMRFQNMMTIAMMTGFLCFQDYIKKSIVIANFTQTAITNKKTQDNVIAKSTMKEKMENKINKAKERYSTAKESAKQSMSELKQKGQGSYYVGLKKTLKQRQQQNKIDKINTQSTDNQIKAVTEQQNTKYSDLASGFYANSQKRMAQMKESFFNKYYDKLELYNKVSQSKSENLVNKHFKFGVAAMLGTIFMPQTYMALSLFYFLSYQAYFFSGQIGRIQKYAWIKDIQFTPIWYSFMITSCSIIGVKGIKKIRTFGK